MNYFLFVLKEIIQSSPAKSIYFLFLRYPRTFLHSLLTLLGVTPSQQGSNFAWKKAFHPKMQKAEEHETKESTTDPESGYYVKGEREKQFAYSCHTACDRHGFILRMIVTPSNVHDSIVFPSISQTVTQHFGHYSQSSPTLPIRLC